MIRPLPLPAENSRGNFGIGERLSNDIQKYGISDMMRAAIGRQDSTGTQQLERTQMDFLITPQRIGELSFALRERRRIQHHEIELGASPFRAVQEIKGIGFDGVDLQAIAFRVAAGCCHRIAITLDRGHARRSGMGGKQRKSSLIREAIEHPSIFGQCGDRTVIPDLVEVKTGFVPVQQIDFETHIVDRHLDRAIDRTVQDASAARKSFRDPNRGVITFDDHLGRDNGQEGLHDDGQPLVEGGRQGLHHQAIPILIDDETGESIRFAPDQTAGIAHLLLQPQFHRLRDSPLEKFKVEILPMAAEAAGDDLGVGIVDRTAEQVVFGVLQSDDIAGLRFAIAFQHFGGVDPIVAVQDSGTWFDNETSHCEFLDFEPPSRIDTPSSTTLNEMKAKSIVTSPRSMIKSSPFRFLALTATLCGLGFNTAVAEVEKAPEAAEATPQPAPAASPSLAQKLDQATIARLLNDSFVNVFEKGSPSVVVISVTKKIEQEDAEAAGDYFQDFFLPGGGTRPPRPIQSEGSGFIVREDGYIYTNNHVIEDADTIKVRMLDGREWPAKLVGTDDRTDVAVLKVEATGLPVAELGNSDSVRVGQVACAIGAPYNLDYTFTVGWVSGKGRSNLNNGDMHVIYEEYIQTDASINPGNSGGPLLDLDGKVIGMNTLINGINRGLGFAIPINMVDEIGKALITDGRVTRPWLGIRIESLKDSQDLQNNQAFKDLEKGVVVVTIELNAPAFGSELKPADVIVAVDGEPVQTDRDLQKKILAKKVGQTVNLTVRRREKTMSIPVVTGELPTDLARASNDAPQPRQEEGAQESSTLGVKVQDLTPELSERLGADVPQGVVVTEVEEGSPAGQAKVMREDVVSEVDGKPVASIADFEAAVKNSDPKRGALLFINRKGEKTFAVLKSGN